MHYCTGLPNKILKWNNTYLSVYYEPIPGNTIAVQGIFAYVSYLGDKIWADVIDMYSPDGIAEINKMVCDELDASTSNTLTP